MIYERTHTSEKHYRCSFCIKMFAQNQDLKKHERTHTGEKTYACSYCDKKFEGNQNIKMHERIQKSKKTIWMFILWQNILQERILWQKMKELIQMKNLIYVCNAFLGHLEICKVLLANQVTKIFMKNNGLTPLHMASGTGKYEVCKILFQAWRKEDFIK